MESYINNDLNLNENLIFNVNFYQCIQQKQSGISKIKRHSDDIETPDRNDTRRHRKEQMNR
jgi:hypothetical protein